MKSARTLITICLLLSGTTLLAQTTPSQQLMKVAVPFAFGVEGHSLPAGEYTILTITPERSIRIASNDGKALCHRQHLAELYEFSVGKQPPGVSQVRR